MQPMTEWMVSILNWLLIAGGQLWFWTWDNLKAICGMLWSVLDAVLNPVLSPVLSILNPICVVVGDVVYAAIGLLPIWAGLILLSAGTGVVMLIFFRYTSNQTAIVRAKDDIKANLLALKLFRDDLRVVFSAQGKVLLAVMRLQRHVLLPVFLATPFMLLVMAQMGIRHQWRPLHPNERTLIKMTMRPSSGNSTQAVLRTHPGVRVEVGPVPGGNQFVWRVRAGQPGRHILQFDIGSSVVEKEFVVAEGLERVSALRPGADWTSQLIHPVERPLPTASLVESIEILYPSLDSRLYGADYWLLTFFVVSMIVALILSPVFKVKF